MAGSSPSRLTSANLSSRTSWRKAYGDDPAVLAEAKKQVHIEAGAYHSVPGLASGKRFEVLGRNGAPIRPTAPQLPRTDAKGCTAFNYSEFALRL